MVSISPEDKRVLKQARDTFGSTMQILVAVEELCELSTVCTKYPRYDDKNEAIRVLHDQALDEVADVIVVLDHITQVFKLEDLEIELRIRRKIERLKRWLETSSSPDITTKDRGVGTDES